MVASSARAQVDITSPAEGVVTTLRNQAVTGHAPPNLPIRVDINGVPMDSGVVRADGVFEFLGVATPEGPITYTVVATMRGGKTFSATRRIHVLGAPDSIALHLPDADIPADGATIVDLSGSVLDHWGVVIPNAYLLTVAADSMLVVSTDVDLQNRGTQVPLEAGVFHVALRASTKAGPASIALEVNGVHARAELYQSTPPQPFMLTGSASATGSYLTMTGAQTDYDALTDAVSGFNKRGRLAVTGRGTILDRYLLTLSIDSDRKLKDRLYRDLDPRVLYSIYGDNSTVTYEAQSASPIFAKLERDQSYMMYGDYNTALTQREFAAYNRTFTGGKLHVQSSWAHADLFGTVTNRKVSEEEIRGVGTSGYYYLGNGNIVTGSEKVRIEVRDRLHSEIVISTQQKTRFSDYDIDYTQGSLYFKQPVPSLDEHGNPVYIVISAEAMTNSSDNYVVGGSGELTIADFLTLGATAVAEERAPTNYMLLGANGGLNLGSFGLLRGEVARSSDADRRGYAWKVEGELSPIASLFTLRPYYRHVDSSFDNAMQRGANQEVGTVKYGLSAELRPLAGTRLAGELYQQTQEAAGSRTDVRAIIGSLRQSLWSGSQATLKVEDVRYDGPGTDTSRSRIISNSMLVGGRVDATILPRLSGHVEGEYNVRTASENARPNSLGAGLEYTIIPEITLFAGQKLLDGGGQVTNVGIRSAIGTHTSLEGRYEIGNTLAGDRSAASIGLRNVLEISDALTANIFFEKTKNLTHTLVDTRTADHDALSVGLEYLPLFPLKASLKGEYSNAENAVRVGLTYGIAYRAFDELSLLARGTYYRDAVPSSPTANTRGTYVFGMAYRPMTSNWLNLVAQVEMRSERNMIVAPTTDYRSVIGVAHAYIEPIAGLEIALKYAVKSANDRNGEIGVTTLTDLGQARLAFDITSWLNIATEGRMLNQRQTGDTKLGASAEVGVVLLSNTMLVGGYNFQGYSERDLVDYTYTSRGPYVTIRAKFTEHLFGFGD